MRAQGGFTLIEIMVVLLIISGLAYIVGTNVIGQLDKSKVENTKIQMTNCRLAIINARTNRILVLGIILDGEFQCRTVKYITKGAVKIVNQ